MRVYLILPCALSLALACHSDTNPKSGGSSGASTGGQATSGGDLGSGAMTADSGGVTSGGLSALTGGTGGTTGTGGEGSGGSVNSSGGAASGSGGEGGSGSMTEGTGGALAGTITLPPEDGALDYQLGGDYTPPAGVQIISRDRQGSPAPGLYNICYVNGFQTQPGELAIWEREHPELLLRGSNGQAIIDPDWPDERMLDVSTPEKRAALAAIEEEWIKGCADRGFDAVEIDNLDTFARSNRLLSEDDAVAFIRLLADIAHRYGLAIAQKNSAEIVSRKGEMGTDFVVAEECNTWNECDVYIDGYGAHVLMIEYVRADFETGCRDYPGHSIVLRDVPLRTPGRGGYIYDGC